MKKFWISAIVTLCLLNLFDAFVTLHAVSKGAEEVNPLMKFALENGFFLQVKILISVLICLCYQKIHCLSVKIAISGNLMFYSVITISHIILLRII